MRLDPHSNTLAFASREELQELHDQLSALVRLAMLQASKHEEDPQKAKELTKNVMQELRTVVRFLNVAREHLPRKSFG